MALDLSGLVGPKQVFMWAILAFGASLREHGMV